MLAAPAIARAEWLMPMSARARWLPIPLIYGKCRQRGELVHAEDFTENYTVVDGITDYSYSSSFSVVVPVGILDAPVRIWADGALTTLGELNAGVSNLGMSRGTSKIIARNVPLARFGNRIPEITVEVLGL
jgi:hypothetical protein